MRALWTGALANDRALDLDEGELFRHLIAIEA